MLGLLQLLFIINCQRWFQYCDKYVYIYAVPRDHGDTKKQMICSGLFRNYSLKTINKRFAHFYGKIKFYILFISVECRENDENDSFKALKWLEKRKQCTFSRP